MENTQHTDLQPLGKGGYLPVDILLIRSKMAIQHFYHTTPDKMRPEQRYPFLYLFHEMNIPAKEVYKFFSVSQPTYSRHLQVALFMMKMESYRREYARVREYLIYNAKFVR